MTRIGFGLDRDGFFAVRFNGDVAECRLPSQLSCDVAMWYGIAWGEREGLAVDVVRVDTKLLKGRSP